MKQSRLLRLTSLFILLAWGYAWLTNKSWEFNVLILFFIFALWGDVRQLLND